MTLDFTAQVLYPSGVPVMDSQDKPYTLAHALSSALFAARRVSDPVKALAFSLELHNAGKLENIDKADLKLINQVIESCESLSAGVLGQIKNSICDQEK